MSGFDIRLQSDQMAQQSQQFYDAQRYQSQREMIGGLQDSAQSIVRSVQTNRAQAMQQRQLQMEAMALQQRMQIEKADADMRLQLEEQRRQEAAMKLQYMGAINQFDAARADTEMRKLQLEASRLDLEERKEQAAMRKESQAAELKLKASRMMDPEQALLAGREFDVDSGSWKVIPDDLRQKRLAEYRDMRSRRTAGGNPAMDRDRVGRELSRMAEMIDNETDPARRETLSSIRDRLIQDYESQVGGEAGTSQGTTATKAEASPEMIQKMMPPMVETGMDPNTARANLEKFNAVRPIYSKMGGWIEANAGALAERSNKARAGANNKAAITAEAMRDQLASILANPKSPKFTALLQQMVKDGVITPEEARAAWANGNPGEGR